MPSLNPGGHSHHHTGSEPLEGGCVRSWSRGSYLPTGSPIPGVGDWEFTRVLEKVTTVGFLPQVSGNFHHLHPPEQGTCASGEGRSTSPENLHLRGSLALQQGHTWRGQYQGRQGPYSQGRQCRGFLPWRKSTALASKAHTS